MSMQKILEDLEKQRQAAESKAKSGIGAIMEALAEANIESLHIRFYGSGDDGSIDDIDPDPGDELRERIEGWAYEVLEGTGVDWYNNDGGQGHIDLDVKARTYEYSVEQNETVSTVAATGKYGVTGNNEIRLET